ncbi:MAG: YceI family protein [Salinivirgaceae bacterium]|jgi:polyisoprenoid-binding protein YceI
MRKVNLVAAFVALVFTVSAQNWTLDKSHAKLGFGITHMMISEVEGQFKNFDIKLSATKPDFTDAVIELSADVSSINTDNEQRDTHLKGADFFDAEKFKTLNFKSTSLAKTGEKTYQLTGDLTMHGITKPVVLEVTFNGTIEHPYTRKTVAGFKVKGKINRSDFAVGTSFAAGMLSEEVTITANAEFSKD